MGKLINPKRYNYYIEDHNELSLHINDLLHTRMYDMCTSFTALQIRITQLGLYVKKPMNEYLMPTE